MLPNYPYTSVYSRLLREMCMQGINQEQFYFQGTTRKCTLTRPSACTPHLKSSNSNLNRTVTTCAATPTLSLAPLPSAPWPSRGTTTLGGLESEEGTRPPPPGDAETPPGDPMAPVGVGEESEELVRSSAVPLELAGRIHAWRDSRCTTVWDRDLERHRYRPRHGMEVLAAWGCRISMAVGGTHLHTSKSSTAVKN